MKMRNNSMNSISHKNIDNYISKKGNCITTKLKMLKDNLNHLNKRKSYNKFLHFKKYKIKDKLEKYPSKFANSKNLIITFNPEEKNIVYLKRRTKSLTIDTISNTQTQKTNNNRKNFKKMFRSNSSIQKTNFNLNYLIKSPLEKKIKYEYNKISLYKSLKQFNKYRDYSDEEKMKYFIRGLALNNEETFFYYKCKKVDFSNNDEFNGNKNKIFKRYNNKKDYKSPINKNINKIQKFGININYSLKRILNNELPIVFKTNNNIIY